MLAKFDKEFEALSWDAQKKILALFRAGDYTAGSLQAALQGHYELVQEAAIRNQEVIQFSKQMANELGVKFAITNDTIKNFDLIQDMNADNLGKNIDRYIAEMRRFGLQAELEGRSLRDITKGLADEFSAMGRRLNTEAYTGIRMADSAVSKDVYEQAGIELYYYLAPDDDKTRDECGNTLGDPKQSTGWTMADIEASATPFVGRGGYNCRHDWIPFVGEVADVQPQAVDKIGSSSWGNLKTNDRDIISNQLNRTFSGKSKVNVKIVDDLSAPIGESVGNEIRINENWEFLLKHNSVGTIAKNLEELTQHESMHLLKNRVFKGTGINEFYERAGGKIISGEVEEALRESFANYSGKFYSDTLTKSAIAKAGKISKYARMNCNEFISEAFVKYNRGEYLPKDIKDLIEEILERAN